MADNVKNDATLETGSDTLVANTATVETTAPATNNEVGDKMKEYGADDATITKVIEEFGVESIGDLASLEVNDLLSAGMKLVKARKLVAEMQKTEAPAAPTVTPTEVRAITNNFDALLPALPTDDSWLNALKTGGILKVDDSSYIAAIRAALADRAGLYNVPDALAKAMEKFADETEEQVDPTFYSLRKLLTRRSYGDIFAAVDGLDGTFITESRRKEFLSRIRDNLWPAIADSYRAVDAWYQTYRASFADPSMLVAVLSGGGPVAGMTAAPDTAPLHDAGDTLVNSINRLFRGTGVQVAAALAYDANVIRKTMEDPRLPAMTGTKNRELMLKKIGTNVSSNYVRLEQNLVKYVLAFVKHDTVTSDVEVNYFIALWQLGAQINWAELGGANPTTGSVMGITGKALL